MAQKNFWALNRAASKLKIFLDTDSYECLLKHVPDEAASRTAISQAVLLGNTRVIACDDLEARDLFVRARSYCPGAVTRISEAMRAVQLRHHPLISYRGLPSWPPTWSPADPKSHLEPLRGEIGCLTHTLPGVWPDRFFLVIEHQDHSYVGCLFIQDSAFCNQVCTILESFAGSTIKEIGDLDLSYTL